MRTFRISDQGGTLTRESGRGFNWRKAAKVLGGVAASAAASYGAHKAYGSYAGSKSKSAGGLDQGWDMVSRQEVPYWDKTSPMYVDNVSNAWAQADTSGYGFAGKKKNNKKKKKKKRVTNVRIIRNANDPVAPNTLQGYAVQSFATPTLKQQRRTVQRGALVKDRALAAAGIKTANDDAARLAAQEAEMYSRPQQKPNRKAQPIKPFPSTNPPASRELRAPQKPHQVKKSFYGPYGKKISDTKTYRPPEKEEEEPNNTGYSWNYSWPWSPAAPPPSPPGGLNTSEKEAVILTNELALQGDKTATKQIILYTQAVSKGESLMIAGLLWTMVGFLKQRAQNAIQVLPGEAFHPGAFQENYMPIIANPEPPAANTGDYTPPGDFDFGGDLIGRGFTTQALGLAGHAVKFAAAHPTKAVTAFAVWNALDQATKYIVARDFMQIVGGTAGRYWEALKQPPKPVDWERVKKQIKKFPEEFARVVAASAVGAVAARHFGRSRHVPAGESFHPSAFENGTGFAATGHDASFAAHGLGFGSKLKKAGKIAAGVLAASLAAGGAQYALGQYNRTTLPSDPYAHNFPAGWNSDDPGIPMSDILMGPANGGVSDFTGQTMFGHPVLLHEQSSY